MSHCTIVRNMQPNPGHDGDSSIDNPPDDFKSRSGLGLMHMNVRNLVSGR